ncbi:MAG: bleomycin resistance protein [Armatimonadota bacterium]|nr:bleomycin resistance protein [Armatimonadota bacterium]
MFSAARTAAVSSRAKRAADFCGLLGLASQKHRHGSSPAHYACEDGGVVFEIYPLQSPGENSTGTRIGFRVSSVDAAVAAREGMVTHIVSPPKDSPWGRRAVVADPDRHRVELTQTP